MCRITPDYSALMESYNQSLSSSEETDNSISYPTSESESPLSTSPPTTPETSPDVPHHASTGIANLASAWYNARYQENLYLRSVQDLSASEVRDVLSKSPRSPDNTFSPEADHGFLIADISPTSSQNVELKTIIDDAERSKLTVTKKKIKSEKGVHEVGFHQCKVQGCGSTFSSPANLKRHESVHTKDKPWACTFGSCTKRFGRKYDLKIHMRLHTKDLPFACAYPNCTKRFGRQSSLRDHERRVHTSKSSNEVESLALSHLMDLTPEISQALQLSVLPTQEMDILNVLQTDGKQEESVASEDNFQKDLESILFSIESDPNKMHM